MDVDILLEVVKISFVIEVFPGVKNLSNFMLGCEVRLHQILMGVDYCIVVVVQVFLAVPSQR